VGAAVEVEVVVVVETVPAEEVVAANWAADHLPVNPTVTAGVVAVGCRRLRPGLVDRHQFELVRPQLLLSLMLAPSLMS
jgi:hypothetical protein